MCEKSENLLVRYQCSDGQKKCDQKKSKAGIILSLEEMEDLLVKKLQERRLCIATQYNHPFILKRGTVFIIIDLTGAKYFKIDQLKQSVIHPAF